MILSQHLRPGRIQVDMRCTKKDEAIRELIDLLTAAGDLKDPEQAYQDVLSRETYLSTGMEHGLAVPHAKTDAVDEMTVAFGLHKAGLDFNALDGQPTHFIFLVVSPRATSGPHIQVLARISRVIKSESVRERLMQANTEQEILHILTQHSG